MKLQNLNNQLVLITLLIIITFTNANTNHNLSLNYEISSLNRSSFPTSFIFGSASSAYQYEGGVRQDGRGPSIWDTYSHKFPGKIADRSNGDVAVDSYHRYKEDVRILKEMGVDAYRFSFSWSRILPHGKVSKGVNKKGLIYYHNLIDELLANGIQPFVTLFHWDLPQSLQDEYGGFLSPQIVADFQDYANICFTEYGKKVKHWMTLNEPWSYSTGIYTVGVYSTEKCPSSNPDYCKFDSGTEPYLVAHYQLLAHAAAVRLYKRKYQVAWKDALRFKNESSIQEYNGACVRLLCSWQKWIDDQAYPITDFSNIDLFFFPCCIDDHYTLFVFNLRTHKLLLIDNRKDSNYVKLQAMANILYKVFPKLVGLNENMKQSIRNCTYTIMDMPWRQNESNNDCGVFLLNHMDLYDGGDTWPDNDLRLVKYRTVSRALIAINILNSKFNSYQFEVQEQVKTFVAAKAALAPNIPTRPTKKRKK